MKTYKVYKNGTRTPMTYEQICKDLGFVSSVHFVKVTSAGTISFTAGKPDEVYALYNACLAHGYKPAQALLIK